MTAPEHVRLLHRLSYLRNWEFANVFLIPAMLSVIALLGEDPLEHWTRRAVGTAPVSYLLLQGSLYWHLKLRHVMSASDGLPVWFRPLFRGFRRTNPLVMAGALILVLTSDAPSGSGIAADLPWAIVLITFAAIEHVNYYTWQLMHDAPADLARLRRDRRLRRPALWRDLRATRTTSARASPTRDTLVG